MAEITVKRVGELLQGVFRLLSNAPDGMLAREALSHLEKEVPPTEFERSDYPNRPGVRRYERIVRFSTVTVVKAGWLTKAKGRWILTDEGRRALEKFRDPEAFGREASRLYRAWDAGREHEEGPTEAPPSVETGDETAAIAFEEAEESAWKEIESHLSQMDPYDFQRLVAALLRGMGYHVAWNAPPGPDHGVDIVAYSDPLGAREPVIKVSVRRRNNQKTDVKDLREFLSLLHGSDVGIFVSLAGFTKPADDLSRQEQRKIRLLDLEHLVDLWVQHYQKIDDADRQLLPLLPVWFLAPKAS